MVCLVSKSVEKWKKKKFFSTRTRFAHFIPISLYRSWRKTQISEILDLGLWKWCPKVTSATSLDDLYKEDSSILGLFLRYWQIHEIFKLVDLDLVSGGQLYNHGIWWFFVVPVYCCRPMWAWAKNKINSDNSKNFEKNCHKLQKPGYIKSVDLDLISGG